MWNFHPISKTHVQKFNPNEMCLFWVRGRSQIRLRRFWFFWDHLPPSFDIFYLINIDKKSTFWTTYPPPLLNKVLWMHPSRCSSCLWNLWLDASLVVWIWTLCIGKWCKYFTVHGIVGENWDRMLLLSSALYLYSHSTKQRDKSYILQPQNSKFDYCA